MNGIEGIGAGSVGPLREQAAGASSVSGKGGDFGDMVKGYLEQVNDLQGKADAAVRDLATGQLDNVHEVVVALSEADLSFRLMMQIRNRLVDAYNEIMKMQV